MKKLKDKILIVFLVFSIILCNFTIPSLATSVQDVEDAKSNLEDKKKEIQYNLDQLEGDKDNVVAYIEKLDTELNRLTKEIDKRTEQKKTVKKELKDKKKELKKAEEAQKKQYDTMKKRIQYMYENGSTEYIEVLFEAGSLSDLLNRTEYISKVSEYDGMLLKRYDTAKKKVKGQKKDLEIKAEKLKNLSEELKVEQEAVQKLVDNKTAELKKYENNIDKSSEEVRRVNEQIAAQEKKIEDMLVAEQSKLEEQRLKDAQIRIENGEDPLPEPVVTVGGFTWPMPSSHNITCGFGPRRAPTPGASTYHKGIDIGAPSGSTIVAAKDGTVVTATYSGGAGNYVMISHGGGIYTTYMHSSKLLVSAGTEVSAGTPIALVGSTGISTGPHLHFAVTVSGEYVNPLNYVS